MLIGKHYKLLTEIGSGTFGKVWLAEHLPSGCQIAIKILEKNKIIDESDVERVTRELKIAQSISHPHLVQLYHLLETSEYVFLVMEYLQGGELYDYIVSKKRLNEEECFMFLVQILSSVEYLHSLNIAHRDLKPENLLLDKERKTIKLVDFGLGRFYDTGVKIETACGSPCYAPPEMLSKLKYDPLKADIWSLGIVLFAMLAGYLPFDDEDTDFLYQKIIEGRFIMPGSVSLDAADLLSKIIQTDPSTRITIAEIKKHPWWVRNSEESRGRIVNCCFDNRHVNLLEINQDIIDKMSVSGNDPQTVIYNVKNRIYSEIFCHYQLLRQKRKQIKKKSPEIKKINKFFKKRPLAAIETDDFVEQKFKNYFGSIDLDFVSLRKIDDVFNELKILFNQSDFEVSGKSTFGSFVVWNGKHEVGFKLSVMRFVDFEEGCCLIFEDFKPKKSNFENFYSSTFREKLKGIIG